MCRCTPPAAALLLWRMDELQRHWRCAVRAGSLVAGRPLVQRALLHRKMNVIEGMPPYPYSHRNVFGKIITEVAGQMPTRACSPAPNTPR